MFRTSEDPTRLLTQKLVKKKGDRTNPREASGSTVSWTVEGVGFLNTVQEGSVSKLVVIIDVPQEELLGKGFFKTFKLFQVRLDSCFTRDVAV